MTREGGKQRREVLEAQLQHGRGLALGQPLEVIDDRVVLG